MQVHRKQFTRAMSATEYTALAVIERKQYIEPWRTVRLEDLGLCATTRGQDGWTTRITPAGRKALRTHQIIVRQM